MVKINTTKENIEKHIEKLEKLIEELKESEIEGKDAIISRRLGGAISAWQEVLEMAEDIEEEEK